MYEKLYENALFEPTRFHTAMNLYENGGLFVFNGLHGRFPTVSYSFIQTEYIYENMKLPIGHFIIHIHRKIIRQDTMAKPRKAAPKSAAAKKAMAERGTFKVGSNSSYDKPYSHLVAAAVAPYVAASKASVSVWGDTLVGCVPPAFAVRYQQLKNELDGQMIAEDHDQVAATSASLCKALHVMDATARTAGHSPPVVDGHLCEWGDKVYCLLASGNVGDVRRQWPSWTVYGVADVCALLSGRTDDIMAAVVNAFPDAKISRVGPMVEDAIDL